MRRSAYNKEGLVAASGQPVQSTSAWLVSWIAAGVIHGERIPRLRGENRLRPYPISSARRALSAARVGVFSA